MLQYKLKRQFRKHFRDLFFGGIIGFLTGVIFVSFNHNSLNVTVKEEILVSTKNYENLTTSSPKFETLVETVRIRKEVKAKELAKTIRILCFILIRPSVEYIEAQGVKDTWGQRCDILLFMSSVNDTKFGTIGLNVPEGRENLWKKTRDAFKYVYEHYYDKADWFVKADDDTFLIVENLRYFLMPYQTSNRHFFGSRYIQRWHFNGGGGAFVLSKQTLKEFYNIIPNNSMCHPPENGAEDVYVAWCLDNLKIYPEDTRDELGRQMFHQLTLEEEFTWTALEKDNIWKSKAGRECCSDYSISYHHISTPLMYQLYYLVYDLRVHMID